VAASICAKDNQQVKEALWTPLPAVENAPEESNSSDDTVLVDDNEEASADETPGMFTIRVLSCYESLFLLQLWRKRSLLALSKEKLTQRARSGETIFLRSLTFPLLL
jgi:hypothetical protein